MRFVVVGFFLFATPAAAQDTLRLPALQEAAVRQDARMRQIELQAAATELRLRNIEMQRIPQLTARGEALYQSEVPGIPLNLPGVEGPRPPKDRYTAALDVRQRLYDGGVLEHRAEVERAQLDVERAEIATALHPLRSEVNEAFFTAFLLQERQKDVALLIADLEARLSLLREQVRAGAALPGDTAVVRAEMLRAEQQRSELDAGRRAALAILSELTEQPVSHADELALPELAAQVARARATTEEGAPTLGERPEYALFAAQRDRLRREAGLIEARSRPQISAFGQAGYGRPGLDLFTEDFHGYWLAGVQLTWTPWDWGEEARDREILEIQRQIIEAEEAAFADRLHRQLQDDLEAMDRLESTLVTDERIIALREQVERQARAQLQERVITPSAYVDVRTDLQEARLTLQRHRVELARTRARYLTTLGIELRQSQ